MTSKYVRFFVSAVVIMGLAVSLFGCAQPAPAPAPKPATPAPAPAPKEVSANLIGGSSSLGGANYLIMSGWAKMIGDKTKINIKVEATAGPSANIKLIEAGNAHIGVSSQVVTYEAYHGSAPWTEGKKHQNIRNMFANNALIFDIIALEKSPIKSMSDLRGKNISVGPAGGSAHIAAERVFKALGIEVKYHHLGQADGASALRDGMLDAIVGFGAAPRPAYQELEASVPIRWVAFTKDELAKVIKEFPMYSTGKLHAKHYKGLKEDIDTLVDLYTYVVHKDVPEEVVYTIVKTTLENFEEYKKLHNSLADLTLKGMYDELIPVHPGALRYFKEKGIAK